MTESYLNYIFCILILGVILFGITYIKDVQDNTTIKFRALVSVAIVQTALALLGEILEGKENFSVLIFVVNYLIYIFVDILMFHFMRYVNSLIGEHKERKVKLYYIIYAGIILRIILITILAFSGNLFTVEEGHYVEGEHAFIPYIIMGAIMVLLIISMIINRECFSTRMIVVIIMYIVIPLIAITIEMYTKLYSLTSCAITLSMLLVYVLLQDSNVEKVKTKQAVLEEISSTDQLTNLRNRRAYYNCIKSIKPDENVGVVFCDVNGLKYTNDHFGHAAGDILLKKFANILNNIFRSEEIYRISGDEFVIIIPDIDQNAFEKRMKVLANEISSNNEIASYGYTFGNGSCTEHLINEAEEKMYDNKKDYYFRNQNAESRTSYKSQV